MTIELDPPVELQTSATPTAAVIWLHGLGADGHDFAGIVPELGLPVRLGLRFVFPHAPMRPVTINGGMVMRAWYDIALSANGFSQNGGHLAESVEILDRLIERERTRGIDATRVVVAGFSQGGAVALHAALRFG
ncbi:MAG TPA: carboxylesterase, partial [Burkholderiales bacterium]|nr:carboxylesterase [Burkholderiales bacterium]